ncbi:MAG: FAD-dependent oxidoreductase [Bacteroidales bacterium]|jgi:all-trans-retinol 13,14-reductase|nr:FAD-dependent oxidoreductase [Bacteroidales bacterium]
MKYDVVIIGGGLGGLQCGYILSREGYNVCLLEKNSQLGGCLQTFRRNNSIFDTGMHYIGSMDEGQVLNNFFRYFGLSGKLNLKKMDENCYDIVKYKDKEYNFAMGHERFIETMLGYFPNEKEALYKYTSKLKEITESVDLFNLRESTYHQTGYLDFFSIGIDEFINSTTKDETLKSVLLGLSPLYAGVKEKSPLYLPMIIHSSFINSAYRFIDGGSQISEILSKNITENGGTIMRKAEVTQFIFDSGKIKAVKINNSEIIEGDTFISNIHPKTLLKIAGNAPLRPAYKSRIDSIEETTGAFTLYLSMKKDAFEYINSNYYVFKTDKVWEAQNYSREKWPMGYMMHFSPSSGNEKYTSSIIANTYMRWEDVVPWKNTTVEKRGDDYREFKRVKAEKLLSVIETDFPGITAKTESYYTSTPLTYRDYIGSPTGSFYGILKDYRDPLRSMVMPRTTIPNLLLTGQNINVHGVIGVTICSVLTCSEIIGTQYLISKMRKA